MFKINIVLLIFIMKICISDLAAQEEDHSERCRVSNQDIHRQNQRLAAQLIGKKLLTLQRDLTARQQAAELNRSIGVLAQQLLQGGMDLSIYSCRTQQGQLSFGMIPLWEGGREAKPSIPLTFFIYVWPPEWLAKSKVFNPTNHATSVHSHPIPCSLTVLRGTIDQEEYLPIKDSRRHLAQRVKTITLNPFATVIDDRKDSFLHRLVSRDQGRTCAISLHGYGAPTDEAVQRIFYQTYSKCVYESLE